jgi:hypothetical protein
MENAMRSAIGVLLVACAAGCASAAQPVSGLIVSSEASDYSPTVRLAVSLSTADVAGDESLVGTVDSATIYTAETAVPDTASIMKDLYLTALVASRQRTTSGTAPRWQELARSDSIRLADALRLGEARHVRGLRLVIPNTSGLNPRAAWLVFRITGAVILRDRVGDSVVARTIPHGIRVFACAAWNLAGHRDKRIEAALARQYNAAC